MRLLSLALSTLFIFSLLLWSGIAIAQSTTTRLENIRFGGGTDKTRIVFDLNQKTVFRAFVTADPYRLIVDLPNIEMATFKAQFMAASIVRGYRAGEIDDGITRLVFDLKKPALIEAAFIVPKDGFNKDRLVVDLKPASVNLFTARKNDVYGQREFKLPTPAKATKPKPASALSEKTDREFNAIKSAGNNEEPRMPLPTRKPQKQEKYTVVIDAGHGGEDPGAIAFGVKEKNITLAVARELRRQLEETGRYKVILTRDKDVYVKLHDRVDISRRVKAHLFISIHADKIDRKGVRGASIYTLSETASDKETERLAEEENNAGFVAGVDLSQESQDVADILLDLAMREKMNESGLFARKLKDSLADQDIRLLPNSHRSAGFAVLKAPDVPSVLVEIGFLSHPEEAKLLSSTQFQRNIATAMVRGTDEYFRKIQALQKP